MEPDFCKWHVLILSFCIDSAFQSLVDVKIGVAIEANVLTSIRRQSWSQKSFQSRYYKTLLSTSAGLIFKKEILSQPTLVFFFFFEG